VNILIYALRDKYFPFRIKSSQKGKQNKLNFHSIFQISILLLAILTKVIVHEIFLFPLDFLFCFGFCFNHLALDSDFANTDKYIMK
jgi:hypothetical protein